MLQRVLLRFQREAKVKKENTICKKTKEYGLFRNSQEVKITQWYVKLLLKTLQQVKLRVKLDQ